MMPDRALRPWQMRCRRALPRAGSAWPLPSPASRVPPDRELEELTFAGLLARSEVVGAALDGCCDLGARVLILAPPGLDYIVAVYGCLIAGRVAVPAYPPRNARNIDRLTTMAGDCGAALVLTTADLIERVAQWGGGRLPEMVALDRLSADSAAGWRAPQVDPEFLAILQYTSGTTGSPKGVMVSHANVTATLSAAELRFDLRPEDKLVTWLPPYHDFGLIGATLQPVFSGFPAVALRPGGILQDPGIWLRTISEQRGTLTLGPNFGFELLCEAKLGDTSALDLSQLRAAAQAASPRVPPRCAASPSVSRLSGSAPMPCAPATVWPRPRSMSRSARRPARSAPARVAGRPAHCNPAVGRGVPRSAGCLQRATRGRDGGPDR